MVDSCHFFIRSGYIWLGQSGTINGYVKFMDIEYECRALALTVMRRFRKLGFVTVGQIVQNLDFKCSEDRDVALQFICSHFGCFPWYVPMRSDWPDLLWCFSFGYHYIVSSDEFKRIIDKYTIVPYLSRENRKLRLRSDFDFIRNGD